MRWYLLAGLNRVSLERLVRHNYGGEDLLVDIRFSGLKYDVNTGAGSVVVIPPQFPLSDAPFARLS
jgi:hypothetical protein